MKPSVLRIAIALLPLSSAFTAAPMIAIPAGAFRIGSRSGAEDSWNQRARTDIDQRRSAQ